MEKNSLITDRIGPVVFRFAMPFLVANILQALYGAVDMFVVGHYADSAALSAVSVGSQVMQTFTSILMGLTTGGTVLLGQRVGAKDGKGAANAVGAMVALFSVVAVVLTVGMFFTSEPFVHLLQTPEAAVPHAVTYVSICVLGLPFITAYNTIASIFRGLGDSKRPMICIAAACLINVAGDFLLIGGLGLGAKGAAIATVVAQGCSVVVALLLLARRGMPFPFAASDIRFHRAETGKILKVGLPLCLQDTLVNMSFLIITAIINSMGLVASAAVGVVGRITGFAFMPNGAFSSAVATVAAQNIGAGRQDRALKSLWAAVGFSLIFQHAVLRVQPVPAGDADLHLHVGDGRHRRRRSIPARRCLRRAADVVRVLLQCLLQRLRKFHDLHDPQPDRHLPGAYSAVLDGQPHGGAVAVRHRSGCARRIAVLHRRLCGILPVSEEEVQHDKAELTEYVPVFSFRNRVCGCAKAREFVILKSKYMDRREDVRHERRMDAGDRAVDHHGIHAGYGGQCQRTVAG